MDDIRKRKWPFMGEEDDSRYSSTTPMTEESDEPDEVCFGSVSEHQMISIHL